MSDDRTHPPSWHKGAAPTLADFEAMASGAFARMPEDFRKLCEDVVIRVADFPDDSVVKAMKLRSAFDLLGLFQGVGLPFRSPSAPPLMPNMIWLYRRPILAYWAEREDSLSAIVTHVLVHEIGHHFGLSDDDIAAIEASGD
jgi:predicted Zn-dependent protease with MMP-like domain